MNVLGLQPELSADFRVFLHHIYEYQKGVRSMVLCTIKGDEAPLAEKRLTKAGICYFVQTVPSGDRVNIFFGRDECLGALQLFLGDRTLSSLSPEEDFIVGAMLGYDICRQCVRYCQRKRVV